MTPFGLAFDQPWVLLALPLLLLLPRARVFPLRLAALALLIVALAQPTVAGPSREVAVLIDVSDSVRDEALRAAQDLDTAALDGDLHVFHFATETAEVPSLQGSAARFVGSESSDLARALQVAAASGAQRILLVSDGAESSGDALAALPPLPVDVLPVESLANVRLVDLIAPQSATPGQTIEVVAVVDSDVETRATLYPSAGGRELEPIELILRPGRVSVPFRFQADDASAVRITASLDVVAAQPRGDDALDIEVSVSEDEPVLVLGDPAFADLLETQGFTVRRGSVSDVSAPLRYSAIAVREGAARFTPGQLDLLRSYVENGGGLIMTGGPESFGFGAWYRTPVEEVLPVSTDLRTEVALPLVALVIVLDRSQSMSTGNPSKIELAKEGAISVVDLAYQDDLLGLIAFSDASSVEWVFELRPATERGKQEMLAGILGIGTQGGTVLEPAYEQAIQALLDTEAAVKHIIILSDGKLYDGQGPFGDGNQVEFNLMANRALASRITTSTIAIGSQADFERLEAIARSGGGRYYRALDVSTLPQIFTNEALTATRSLLRDEAFIPTVGRHPLLPSGGLRPPAVDAYIASTLKPSAEMLIEGVHDEPILAISRQGLGRSAALTTDLNAWAGAFGSWPELPGLLGTVSRWLQSRPAQYSASIDPQGDELFVVVDAVRDGAYIDNRNLGVRYGGNSAALEQVAPGRYEGRIPAAGSGTLLVVDGNEVVARSRVTQPSPEFDTADGRLLLERIAQRSGGQVLAPGDIYAPVTPATARPIWFAVALAGLLLFLIELVLRRFGRTPSGAVQA